MRVERPSLAKINVYINHHENRGIGWWRNASMY